MFISSLLLFLKNGNKRKAKITTISYISAFTCFLKSIINHMCRLKFNKPVEQDNHMPSPNFEFPVYEAEEEEEDIPDKISCLLEQERRTIQPYGEKLEVINLGTKEDKKEVKIGASMDPTVKKRIIELLKAYVDVFAWS